MSKDSKILRISSRTPGKLDKGQCNKRKGQITFMLENLTSNCRNITCSLLTLIVR